MSKNNNLTGQGVKNLNHGRTIRRNETPDDCTLGLHHWDIWQRGYPFADYRECMDCPEVEYYTSETNKAA